MAIHSTPESVICAPQRWKIATVGPVLHSVCTIGRIESCRFMRGFFHESVDVGCPWSWLSCWDRGVAGYLIGKAHRPDRRPTANGHRDATSAGNPAPSTPSAPAAIPTTPVAAPTAPATPARASLDGTPTATPASRGADEPFAYRRLALEAAALKASLSCFNKRCGRPTSTMPTM